MAKETRAGRGGEVRGQGEAAATGMEAGAPRLTKPAEGAALRLPVLLAPPREPRSPAAPSGSPEPPPLREATWTCRFGPSAKSRLQGGGSPPPRPGSPRSSSPHDRRLSVRGALLEHGEKAEGGGAGTRPCGRGEGRPLFGASGPASGRDRDCGAGGLQGRSPPGGRALREHEPGGGASESESDKPPPLRKVLRGRRGPRGLRLSCRPSPRHSLWKVFEATKASRGSLGR